MIFLLTQDIYYYIIWLLRLDYKEVDILKITQFPTWEELPDLDLYLDQVLLYVNGVNEQAFRGTDKSLTAAMVNNYVKHAHIPKPIKKKYNRIQIARLIVLTTLKPVFPIPDIIKTIQLLVNEKDSATLYNEFVYCMREEKTDNTAPAIEAACQTVKLFHQTKDLALSLERRTKDEPNP